MPALFVPEEGWGPGSWAMNHPLTADAQIDHGLDVAGYAAWGFSFSNNPDGGYSGYGVDAIGMNPEGEARTTTARWSTVASPAARTAPRSPTRRRARTRTASSRRTPPSSACAGAPRRRSPRSRARGPRRLHPARLLRRGERPDRRALAGVPVARSGDDHGGARQRARARRPARRVRHPRPRARGAPGGRGRGVQRPAARLHDHRDRGRRPAVGHLARRRDLRPRRRRRDPRLGRRRRRLRRRGRRRGARRRRRRHALRGRRRRRPARPARPRRARRRPGRRRAAGGSAATTPSRAVRSPPLACRCSVPRR